MHEIAVLVSQNLYFYMLRSFKVFLNKHVIYPKSYEVAHKIGASVACGPNCGPFVPGL